MWKTELGIENKVHHSMKVTKKCFKNVLRYGENMRKLWYTTKNSSNKIIEEKFPALKREMLVQVQEAIEYQWTGPEKKFSRHR